MPILSTALTTEETSFLQTLNFDPNSSSLKSEIQTLLKSQKANSQENPNSNLTQILNKIYTKIIPQLQKSGQTWDIDYNFERSENKRWESLKKRGCSEIIKVE